MRTVKRANKKQAAARMTKKVLIIVLGAAIYTFGIHNIHQRTAITEGGIIGLMLLIEHWFSISPAYITPVLDFLCYLLAFRFLGGGFIRDSIIATLAVYGWYKVWEQFPPMLPDLSAHPLAAALAGGTGETAITETIFDHRFRYAQGLEALGAQVRAAGERKPFFLSTPAKGEVRGGSPAVKKDSRSM